MSEYKFPCGCEIPIASEEIKDCDGLPSLDINYYNLPDCPATWEIFHSGKTKGIFQLEKQLGQGWSKEIKPSTIDEVSTLIALIRPGCLNSLVDGKNMTKHYADRKNAVEEVKYFYKELEPILRDTYNVLVFQEQSIQIAKDLAGFSLQEADQLRRATGKKDAKLMAETEILFIEKAKAHGVISEEAAKEIFGWIKESNRYSFNRCLTWDTSVRTPNGSTDIRDIKIGDKVYGPNTHLKTREIEVVDKIYTGLQPVFEVTFSNDKTTESIKCTVHHKFFVFDLGKSIPLHEIIANDYKALSLDGTLLKFHQMSYIGLRETYDIEIDSALHCFYADGLCVSNSHSVAYAELGYWSAFVKYHFPFHFFTSWLQHRKSDSKDEHETKLLLDDSKSFKVEVGLPSILNLHYGDPGQTLLHNNNVNLGISDIKGLGDSQVEKIIANVFALEETLGPIDKWTWTQFLVHMSNKISSTAVNGLISTGSLSHFGISRTKMLSEYNIWSQLTKSQQAIVLEYNFENLGEILEYLSNHKKVRNKDKILDLLTRYRNSPYALTDGPGVIMQMENEWLQAPISCSRLDSCPGAIGDTTCLDFDQGKNASKMSIAVEITRVRTHITKSGKSIGQEMAFMSAQDQSGVITNIMVFAGVFSKYKQSLYEGNTVILEGKRSDWNNKTSFAVERVIQV